MNLFKTMKQILFIFFFFINQIAECQDIKSVENALIGTWRGTGKHIYPTENDSIEYKYVGEELNNFVIDKKNIRLWLSSNNSPDNFFGKYKVVYDQKTKSHWIIVKKTFGNCTEKKMEIVSISDSLLIINSCINPIQVIYKKSPLPEQQITNVKELLEGKWNYIESCNWKWDINGQLTKKEIVDTTLIAKSFYFKGDSIYVEIIGSEKILVSKYNIIYTIENDNCSIELLEYTFKSLPNSEACILQLDFKPDEPREKKFLFFAAESFPFQYYEKE